MKRNGIVRAAGLALAITSSVACHAGEQASDPMASRVFPPDNPDLFWNNVLRSREWEDILELGDNLDPVALTLFEAVMEHDRNEVAAILDRGASPDLLLREGGWSPLMVAIAYNDHETTRLLVERGADVNYVSENQIYTTPLKVALSFGRFHTEENPDFSLFRYLLNIGADMNIEYQGGNIARDTVTMRRFELTGELLDRGFRKDLPELRRSLETRTVRPESQAEREALLERIDALIATDD